MHTPVYLDEAIEALNVRPGGKYIDATLGEGGHFERIAALGGRVLGIDWDEEQIKGEELRIKNYEGSKVVRGNFADVEQIAAQNGFVPTDGILFDLGLSFRQLKQKGIGLSFKVHTEPLDMRLSPTAEMTAAEVLNRASEDELYEVFAKGAEDIHARPIAHACVEFRKGYKFATVGDFIDLIDRVVTINPHKSYARLFQALRIQVNDEFGNLKKGLLGGINILAPEGRMAVITFHSVEDRFVKLFTKSHGDLISNAYKVIKKNSAKFERSALLRVIIKK